MLNEFGLILCECGRILDEEQTETFQEQHDAGHYSPMSRTTCCGSGYTDLTGEDIVKVIVAARDAKAPPWRFRQSDGGLSMVPNALSQILRGNLDAIIPVLEQKFDL